MWGMLVKPLLGVASDVVKGVVDTRKAKAEQKVTKIKAETELLNKQIAGQIEYDVEAIKGSKDSFKDEWILILWSIPMVLIWFPGLQGHVQNGFEALKTVPDWYFITWGAIVSATFGAKSITKVFDRKKK